jgi:CubicO group peptidase (beta-lactamase class C family)
MNDPRNERPESRAAAIHGRVAPGFEPVREAFAANFSRADDYREVGAALAVYHAGRCIVDLWAGHADRARVRAWQRDTLINVYSATKGIVATAAALLVETGKLRYEDPVTKYWPEFGRAGKETTTVAHLLSHQAGLTGFMEPTSNDDLYDWDARCAALARQTPFWTPGTTSSYHAMTWGYLVGEVIRRAAGMSVGQFIQQRLACAIGADVYVGLPSEHEPRVAEMLRPLSAPDLSALTQPPQALAALVNPQLDPEIPNTRAWRAAEIPAANGQASAQGIARVYATLANSGDLDGTRLLGPATIQRMLQVQAQRPDLLLGFQNNWALGMSLNQVGMLGPKAETFGHAGWGGSFGCANLETKIGIGYVCNQMGAQLVGDPRGAGLCHAVFGCL